MLNAPARTYSTYYECHALEGTARKSRCLQDGEMSRVRGTVRFAQKATDGLAPGDFRKVNVLILFTDESCLGVPDESASTDVVPDRPEQPRVPDWFARRGHERPWWR